jgi:hypothetical protein
MLDPSRGVGTYECVENATCCDHLDELRAKCSVIDGVAECIYRELEDFVVTLTVEGNQILVDCYYVSPFVDICLLFLMWIVCIACLTDPSDVV